MRALLEMRSEAIKLVSNGRSILIFPQGTRVPPGEEKTYEIGVFALYQVTGLPVIPVALNSGHVWPKNSWTKKSGLIQVEFLQPISPGLKRKKFMSILVKLLKTNGDY